MASITTAEAPKEAPSRYRRARPGLRTVRVMTWGEWIDTARDGVRPYDAKGFNYSRKDGGDMRASWAGTDTYEEADKLAREGWPKGERIVREFAKRLEASLISKIVREDLHYDTEGMGFDVARYVEGEPEHWYQPEETLTEGPHRNVRVILNQAASCGVSAEVLTARGAAVCALVELLEYAGTRVEVWTACGLSGIVEFHVKVKAYDQPIEPSRLAFAMAHPGAFRRITFSHIEQLPTAYLDYIGLGYGYPHEVARDAGDIYVGEAMYGGEQWTDPARAVAWVRTKLEAQGVKFDA